MDVSGAIVFSATRAEERNKLGDRATAWLRSNPRLEPVDTIVLLTSDNAYHCMTIVIFYRPRKAAAP